MTRMRTLRTITREVIAVITATDEPCSACNGTGQIYNPPVGRMTCPVCLAGNR